MKFILVTAFILIGLLGGYLYQQADDNKLSKDKADNETSIDQDKIEDTGTKKEIVLETQDKKEVGKVTIKSHGQELELRVELDDKKTRQGELSLGGCTDSLGEDLVSHKLGDIEDGALEKTVNISDLPIKEGEFKLMILEDDSIFACASLAVVD